MRPKSNNGWHTDMFDKYSITASSVLWSNTMGIQIGENLNVTGNIYRFFSKEVALATLTDTGLVLYGRDG